MSETPPGRLWVASEIAQLLGVKLSWVREYTRAKDGIPHYKLGRYRRYDPDAVVAWLEDQRAGRWRKHSPTPPASLDA